jgi:pyruvate dehydrogenase E2 component (dihydrolipoamide acetyltransferase)
VSSPEPTEIVMPRLSDSMESGTVTRWLKQVGDVVACGDALLEVETDKATVEVESDDDGFLAEIVVAAEAQAAVGAVVGWIVARAELLAQPRAAAPTGGSEDDPPGATAVPSTEAPTGAAPTATLEPLPAQPPVVASPAARRLAREAEVDLHSLAPGSGPDGRIVRKDIERATARHPAAQSLTSTGSDVGAPAGGSGHDPQAPSRSHFAMAAATSRSKAEAPHFYLNVDVGAGTLLELKRELQRASGSAVSLTALLVKATAMALERHPPLQRQWSDGILHKRAQLDVGVAVAQPSGELIVPVLRTPGSRPLLDLSEELTILAERVRTTNRLPLSALGGATITVSNLGARGIREFYPIIDGGQSAIVGVGAIRQELSLVAGVVRPRPTLTLSLSVDHRVVAGAGAADFLAEIRDTLENPIAMVV